MKLKDGQEVTTLEELQQKFDLKKVIEYFINGKLQKWLENIYEDDIAEELEELTGEEGDFVERFIEVLGVQCEKKEMDMHKIREEITLKERLKEFFPEEKIENVAKETATNQEKLEQLVSEGVKEIYLLSEAFYIEKEMKELDLIGVDTPFIETEETDAEQFYMQHIQLSGKYKKGENLSKVLKGDTREIVLLEFLDMLENSLMKIAEEEQIC